ncbi:MAG: hypothetical protein HQK81_08325 [Desulfovibrionaceae bacterium]|nr:hypothetical protein [Desulfovibrionaceae bacterium]MBF0514056.1 hypothetical protein [Desulfovibrionaceae bacterium]
MESNAFTFELLEIDKIREMISGEVEESTTNQIMMILKDNCQGVKLISVTDLRELLCDYLSPKHLFDVMHAVKSNQP